MKIEAATRLKASQVFYRGLNETWKEDHARNQHLIFVTSDHNYALEYAKDADHVYAFHVNVVHPFEFGFRTLTTQVKLNEVCSRIRDGVLGQFKQHHISDVLGRKLVEELRRLSAAYSGHKEVWEWYMELPQLIQVLKAAGFDAIKAYEGQNNNIETYGLFSSNQLTKV